MHSTWSLVLGLCLELFSVLRRCVQASCNPNRSSIQEAGLLVKSSKRNRGVCRNTQTSPVECHMQKSHVLWPASSLSLDFSSPPANYEPPRQSPSLSSVTHFYLGSSIASVTEEALSKIWGHCPSLALSFRGHCLPISERAFVCGFIEF